MFNKGDLAVLNEKVKSGLPSHIGDLVLVLDDSISSVNFDYSVELPNGETVPVKESELNKVNESDYIMSLHISEKVLVMPKEELATVIKIDYLHGKVNVQYEIDETYDVVGIEQIRKIENEGEKMEKEEFKFKIGDKVKTKTKDVWNDKEGNVIKAYTVDKEIKAYD